MIQKREIAPGILIYENVIPNHENLVKDIEDAVEFNTIKWDDATVYSKDEVGVKSDIRNTSIMGIKYIENPIIDYSNPHSTFQTSVSKLFYDSFNPLEKDYMHQFAVNFKQHESYGILKYGVGQKFTNHIDDHGEYPRRISTVYYMNEDYTGGEIIFPRFNITYKPKPNEMIFFPSSFVYNHSVLEVTSGTRYAVVSWIY